MSITSKLIFDIETIGVDFDALDETTQDSLTRWIKKNQTAKKNTKWPWKSLKTAWDFRL